MTDTTGTGLFNEGMEAEFKEKDFTKAREFYVKSMEAYKQEGKLGDAEGVRVNIELLDAEIAKGLG